MEENKVVLSLEEYLRLYDSKKDLAKTIKELLDYLFEIGLEVDSKKEIVFDKYNLSNDRLKQFLIRYDKDRVEAIERALKEDED